MKKTFKKLMAALLAVAMLCAMAIPAFAASGTNATKNGSITIDPAVKGETYTIYKMFDLLSYDTDNNKYSYTVNSDWESFFAVGAAGADYITLANGHPTWTATENAATYEAFAKAALTWAKTNNIPTAATPITASSEKVEFTGLDLGYYLVDTSLGSLCSLTTTAPNAKVYEKNDKPEIDKKIKEGENLVSNNTAKVGDTVNYEVTVTVQKGTTGYVVRDKMDSGLTFNNGIVVKVGDDVVDSSNYTISTSDPNYTFTLAFEDDYILGLSAGTKITVLYSAVINENALIDSPNKNTVDLKYGNAGETTKKEVETKVYEFDLVKFDGTSGKLLTGAEFKLWDAEDGGNEIKLVKTGDASYRVATADEIADGKAVDVIKIESQKAVNISGLAGKVYWLEETKAPDGYNILTHRTEANLTKGSKKAALNNSVTYDASMGGVAIANNAGTTLPSTGGIGTTIFYVIGGGLMIAAAVLLITKKRMEGKN